MYIIGFICTLIGSSITSLLVSFTHLSFENILRKGTFSVVLEFQIYRQLVMICAPLIGLFASGEWRGLYEEMEGFGKGRFGYVMTFFMCSSGMAGLVFLCYRIDIFGLFSLRMCN